MFVREMTTIALYHACMKLRTDPSHMLHMPYQVSTNTQEFYVSVFRKLFSLAMVIIYHHIERFRGSLPSGTTNNRHHIRWLWSVARAGVGWLVG